MATSLTHTYIPRIQQTEENLFIEEYYCNADTKIYTDGVEQTEIGYISYSLQEQLKPIYGYASSTFDDVAIGTRIVVGGLKIPIKNTQKQSTKEEIKERSKNANAGFVAFDFVDYNTLEQNTVDNSDWVGTTDKYTNPLDFVTNDDMREEVYEYITKLMSLGYNVDTNADEYTFRTALGHFQQDTLSLHPTGILDYNTKKEIDNAIVNRKRTVTLEKGINLLTAPMSGAGTVFTCLSPVVACFIERFDKDWIYVMTINDGIEGFVCIKDYPMLQSVIEHMEQ